MNLLGKRVVVLWVFLLLTALTLTGLYQPMIARAAYDGTLHYEFCDPSFTPCKSGGQFPPTESFTTILPWCKNGPSPDYELVTIAGFPSTDGYTGDFVTCDQVADGWLNGGSFSEWIGVTLFEIPTGRQEECNAGGIDEDLAACRAISVAEAKVLEPPPAPPGAGGPTEFPPKISILAPNGGAFSSSVNIQYGSSDLNDVGGDVATFGLGQAPVSIYYSVLIDTWDMRIIPKENAKLVVKGVPAEGNYQWDVRSVPEGDRYRIIANVQDNFGVQAEQVTDFITIDHTPPTFSIKTDPPYSKGESVTIVVTASEDLPEPPRLTVFQRGYQEIPLILEGKGRVFTGNYGVISGYDGPAKMSVAGKDIAGNESGAIISGGQFSVGVEPPPKPSIMYPLNNEVATSSSVSVSGRVREDSVIFITVNGKDKYKATPDSSGSFGLAGVSIDPKFNHGLNILSFQAQDQAGNLSESVDVNVKFNLDPVVSFVFPKKGTVLSGLAVIKVAAEDANKDSLSSDYEYSPDGGKNWISLSKGISGNQYNWDTRLFPDGDYLLRVTVSDGTAKVPAFSGQFSVLNNLPVISFNGGELSTTNKKDYVITGSVVSKENQDGSSRLTSIEASLDGKTWQSFNPDDGTADSFSEKFSYAINNLEEKKYKVFFRAKTIGERYGYGTKEVLADFGPPAAPVVISPAKGTVIGNAADLSAGTAGTRFDITGTGEPGSFIHAISGGVDFSGTIGEDGKFSLPVDLLQHGQNDLNVFVSDLAGNTSGQVSLPLVYNNPPDLKIIEPREGRGLNHHDLIRFEAVDPDGDRLQGLTLSYRKGGQPFTVIARNPAKSFVDFDVSNLPEGHDYQLKLEATDGISPASVVVNFSVDNTQPVISPDIQSQAVFTKSFTLTATGSALDNFSGIEYVEYTLDGMHWFKAIITDGYLKTSARYKITHPYDLPDGEYDFSVRAVDASGNVSSVKTEKITVDKIAPRVGSYILSSGSLPLAQSGGVFTAPAGSVLDLSLSLESDTKEASLNFDGQDYPLAKDKASGLWKGRIGPVGRVSVATAVLVSASDNAGNRVIGKDIGRLEASVPGFITGAGQPIGGASISVFVFDEGSQRFVPWSAASYNQAGEVLSDSSGAYQLLLPPGKFRLLIEKSGFVRLRSSDFDIPGTQFVNFDFALTPRSGIRGFFENILDIITR